MNNNGYNLHPTEVAAVQAIVADALSTGNSAAALVSATRKSRPIRVAGAFTSYWEEQFDDQIFNAREASYLARGGWPTFNALEGNPVVVTQNAGVTGQTLAQFLARITSATGGYLFGKSAAPGWGATEAEIGDVTAPQNDFTAGTSNALIESQMTSVVNYGLTKFVEIWLHEQPALGPAVANWVSTIRPAAEYYNQVILPRLKAIDPDRIRIVPNYKYSVDPSSAERYGYAANYRASGDHYNRRGAMVICYPALKECANQSPLFRTKPASLLANSSVPIVTQNKGGLQLQADPFFLAALTTVSGSDQAISTAGVLKVGSQYPAGVVFDGVDATGAMVVQSGVFSHPTKANVKVLAIHATFGVVTPGTTHLQLRFADSQSITIGGTTQTLADLGINFTDLVGALEYRVFAGEDIIAGGLHLPTGAIQTSNGLENVSPNIRKTANSLAHFRRAMQRATGDVAYGAEAAGKVFEAASPPMSVSSADTVLRTGVYIWPAFTGADFCVVMALPTITKAPSSTILTA